MTELNTAVITAMQELNDDGSVKKMIKSVLEKTVKNIIENQFQTYSTFGKILKEKIESELMIDLNSVNFSQYNQTILNLIEGQVNNAVTGEAQEKLNKDIIALFGEPPKEIKLSALIEQYKVESQEDCVCDGEQTSITLLITEKHCDLVTVSLHPSTTQAYKKETITSWQHCDLLLNVNMDKENKTKGKLSWTYDRSGLTMHAFMPTCLSGTSRLLYQMYCAGSTLIFDQGLDADDYNREYSQQYD